jgi:PPOX class probable F420-dependent enzyme
VALDREVQDFITAGNFAALTTLLPSGQPQTQVMWVDADDDHVLINTEVHRAKYANVEHDPRVTVCVWDKDSPYRYVEVRGQVVEAVRGQSARDHIDVLSQRYRGKDYPPEFVQTERVILRIAPDRVVTRP